MNTKFDKDNLKNKDNLKSKWDLRNKDDLKIEDNLILKTFTAIAYSWFSGANKN